MFVDHLALNKTMTELAMNGTSLEDYNYENKYVMKEILDQIAKVNFMGMSVSCILTGLKSEKSITYDTKGNFKSDRMKSSYHWVWQTVLNICCVNKWPPRQLYSWHITKACLQTIKNSKLPAKPSDGWISST